MWLERLECTIRRSSCLMLLVNTPAMHAQTTSGSFVGRVVDSAGAVIPGATLTLRNKATGVALTQESNTDGDYTFNYVRPSGRV